MRDCGPDALLKIIFKHYLKVKYLFKQNLIIDVTKTKKGEYIYYEYHQRNGYGRAHFEKPETRNRNKPQKKVRDRKGDRRFLFYDHAILQGRNPAFAVHFCKTMQGFGYFFGGHSRRLKAAMRHETARSSD